MDRRHFLLTGAALAATLPTLAHAEDAPTSPPFAPNPANGWRTFEVITRLEIVKPEGNTRAWVPLPSVDEAQWIRPLGNLWQGNAVSMQVLREPTYGTQMLYAQWDDGEPAPAVEVTSRFATRDRAIDLSAPGKVAPLPAAAHKLYTSPTQLLPLDGIVHKTALQVTQGAKADIDKARAIYEWIVENTQRNPKTRGCGTGDIRAMLETGNLSGKCADLNALFVGLARSVGLPARDVYGIRVADSRYGYKSLGKSGDITKAQHCRAEVWLAGFGWVPVDPADVRKVVLEEKPGLTLADEMAVATRKTLFGAWEMNWLGYNTGHDIALPHSQGAKLPFLMYPQGETTVGRIDSLESAAFRYQITSRELKA